MRTSLSFLAYDHEQLPEPGRYCNDAVEAVIFNRDHLEEEPWQATWINVEIAVAQYGPDNVTFHFPMNESDYIEDDFVYKRLVESYQRATDLDLAGVIVHSNRIRPAAEWRRFNQTTERAQIGELLAKLRETNSSSSTWIALENMPSVGNYGDEVDPLYISPADFDTLPSNIGIVWDVCHAMCSLQYAQAHQKGELPDSIYLRPDAADFANIESISERVAHWHFASSKGLNLPSTGTTCTEGMLPKEGDLPELMYEQQIRIIHAIGSAATVNFEVLEDDYSQRLRGPAIIAWARNITDSL